MIRTLTTLLASTLAVAAAPFLVLAALTTGVTFFAADAFVDEEVEQPVVFNHRLHVEDQGLECAMCHAGCFDGVTSGLPATAGCALCHETAQGESAAEQQLVAMLESGTPLQWRPLFEQPRHVFFSHRRHTTVAGIECTECHGDIGSSAAPPRHRAPLSMERCIECHEASGAPVDCTTCHR